MSVHSTPVGALEGDMQTCTSTEPLPFEAGDVEWVADLLDTVRDGDLDAAIDQLEELARVMRKAAKARRMLATVDPSLLRKGLVLRQSRFGASR